MKAKVWLDKVEVLVEELANEMDEIVASDMYKRHLETMSRFWHYSFGNQMLIALQFPGATFVAGFNRWKIMGRFVRKGERGIHILAPGIKKLDAETEDEDEDGVIRYFFPVTVFDISQTDGDELPIMDACVEGADAERYMEALVEHCRQDGTVVKYETMAPYSYGWSSNGEVAVNAQHSVNTQFASMVHEVAHEMLHWDHNTATKQRYEAEAEGTSYVVLTHYGIESKAPSYLALSAINKDVLKASLTNISNAAKRIITAIETKLDIEQVA